MLEQTQKLMVLFDENQKNKINNIIKNIEKEGEKYKTIELWKFDQSLGGIGGYCQGCDPANSNPFQGTIYRNAYRCFQYIRADIDMLDINNTARDIVRSCGQHFEVVIKIYLSECKKIDFWKSRKYPLGMLLKYVIDKKIFNKELCEKIRLFVDLYNISKHEILSNDQNDRTFHLDDALLCYYATRIVGKEILLEFNCENALEKYGINWNKYGHEIERF